MPSRPYASKSALSLAAVVLGVLALPSLSLAAPAPPPQPLQDSAVGAVFLGSGTHAGFDAQSGPRGENPSGSAFFLTLRSEAAGPVTCLTVIGNRATIGFENTLGGGSGGFFFVEDHGYTPPFRDTFRFQAVPEPPAVCPVSAGVGDPVLDGIAAGDIAVHDAEPLSKDQCKNGGWAQFGFKNQGQCVAFLQRGPKP